MTDPLYLALTYFFRKPLVLGSMFADFPIVINLLVLTMVILAIKGSLNNSEEDETEQRWVDIHGDLVRRIEKLMPVYRNTNIAYIKAQMGCLTRDKKVVYCMRSIKESVKQRAEIDFVMHDANRPENIAILQSQLEALAQQTSSTTPSESTEEK